MHLTPAAYVISIFGSMRKTARAVGRTNAAVCMWTKPRIRGGCGGHVPAAAQRIILALAQKNFLPITPKDLLLGREVKIKKTRKS